MTGVSRQERNVQVMRAAEALRITDLLQRYPKELSGGQRQRVAIGRAIVRKPKVFLFDEPLSNLDAELRVSMRIELSRLHKELGTTMIYVTHDQVEAMTMGDRIAVFHQGTIAQLGKPMDLYQSPANESVAGFIGSPRINFISAPTEVSSSTAHRTLWQQSLGTAPASTQKIGIRPEHVGLAPNGQGIAATVELVEQLGDSSVIHLHVDGLVQLMVAKLGASQEKLGIGQSVGLVFDHVPSHLAFDKDGLRLTKR
jgi:multiple sugar transport system ATP-binding protein